MEHGDARKQAYETFWEICNTPVLLSSRENCDVRKTPKKVAASPAAYEWWSK